MVASTQMTELGKILSLNCVTVPRQKVLGISPSKWTQWQMNVRDFANGFKWRNTVEAWKMASKNPAYISHFWSMLTGYEVMDSQPHEL